MDPRSSSFLWAWAFHLSYYRMLTLKQSIEHKKCLWTQSFEGKNPISGLGLSATRRRLGRRGMLYELRISDYVVVHNDESHHCQSEKVDDREQAIASYHTFAPLKMRDWPGSAGFQAHPTPCAQLGGCGSDWTGGDTLFRYLNSNLQAKYRNTKGSSSRSMGNISISTANIRDSVVRNHRGGDVHLIPVFGLHWNSPIERSWSNAKSLIA